MHTDFLSPEWSPRSDPRFSSSRWVAVKCLSQAQSSEQLGRSTHIHVLLMAVPHRDLPSLNDIVAVHSSVCHGAHIHAPVLAHLQQHKTWACRAPITCGHGSVAEGTWEAPAPARPCHHVVWQGCMPKQHGGEIVLAVIREASSLSGNAQHRRI